MIVAELGTLKGPDLGRAYRDYRLDRLFLLLYIHMNNKSVLFMSGGQAKQQITGRII